MDNVVMAVATLNASPASPHTEAKQGMRRGEPTGNFRMHFSEAKEKAFASTTDDPDGSELSESLELADLLMYLALGTDQTIREQTAHETQKFVASPQPDSVDSPRPSPPLVLIPMNVQSDASPAGGAEGTAAESSVAIAEGLDVPDSGEPATDSRTWVTDLPEAEPEPFDHAPSAAVNRKFGPLQRTVQSDEAAAPIPESTVKRHPEAVDPAVGRMAATHFIQRGMTGEQREIDVAYRSRTVDAESLNSGIQSMQSSLPAEPRAIGHIPAQPAWAQRDVQQALPDWPDRLVEHIQLTREGASSRLELALKPESLGKVEVQLVWDQGKLQAHFNVQGNEARLAVEQQLGRLQEALQQRGIQLESCSVGLGFAQHDSRQPGDQPRSRRVAGISMSSREGELTEARSTSERTAATGIPQDGLEIWV